MFRVELVVGFRYGLFPSPAGGTAIADDCGDIMPLGFSTCQIADAHDFVLRRLVSCHACADDTHRYDDEVYAALLCCPRYSSFHRLRFAINSAAFSFSSYPASLCAGQAALRLRSPGRYAVLCRRP